MSCNRFLWFALKGLLLNYPFYLKSILLLSLSAKQNMNKALSSFLKVPSEEWKQTDKQKNERTTRNLTPPRPTDDQVHKRWQICSSYLKAAAQWAAPEECDASSYTQTCAPDAHQCVVYREFPMCHTVTRGSSLQCDLDVTQKSAGEETTMFSVPWKYELVLKVL